MRINKTQFLSILLLFAFCSAPAFAIPYQVSMDNVENLANWALMDDEVGDLYDSGGTKQVEVSYTERVGFGNTAVSDADPQFWQSLEYGDFHRAIFADAGGSDVLEVEIAGLNGHLIDLSQVLVGRWYPDPINTLASDWRVYDGAWNLLADGNTLMTDFVDYFLNFDVGVHEIVRFQLGHDNWDNGIIAFTYETDVVGGTLDLALDHNQAPTPNLPGSSSVPVPEPSVIALMGLGLVGLGLHGRRRKSI